MWIVRLALRRPYTFVVLALLIAVLGAVSIVTMTVDIFPAINIPVVTVIWNYSGLSPTLAVNLQIGASIQLIKALGGGWNPSEDSRPR
jgi:multidrug efflux pump subunit AcrB